jgi:hypothetical protein
MINQLTSNAEALRLFFTEDVYLVKNEVEVVLEKANEKLDSMVARVEAAVETVAMPIIEEEIQLDRKKEWNFEYLGKNQKGILILVNDSVNKVSSVQGTELLRKLVKAIELTNNDFALVNYANYPEAKFEDLTSFFNCKVLLVFGVDPVALNLTAYGLHQLHVIESTRLIFTTNLHELDSDQISKKTLWTTLQQLK